ncbi:hypothetical protein BH11ARM2_BH11ARM2_38560 [soil metagenome]
MSLVLPHYRPAPVRDVLLPVLIAAGLLASALGLAPTLARTATGHSVLCTCAHCPGGAACCCRGMNACPSGHL